MKVFVWIVAIVLALAGGFYFLNNYIYNEKQGDVPMRSNSVEIIPIEHATAVIRWDDAVFYLDPIGGAEAFSGQLAPNIVLLTDIHGDHFSTSTIEEIMGNATLIVPQAVKDQLPADLASHAHVLANDNQMAEMDFTITAVPMYNLPDASNSNFHTKGRGNGYIVERDGFRLYIAGDTAGTPEMRSLSNIDVALVPMNLPYTMSIEEAADAVLAFKPKKVYPYHYRGPDGLADVAKFKTLVNAGDPTIEVVLANWYSEN